MPSLAEATPLTEEHAHIVNMAMLEESEDGFEDSLVESLELVKNESLDEESSGLISFKSISQHQSQFLNAIASKRCLLKLDLYQASLRLTSALETQIETPVSYFNVAIDLSVNGYECQMFCGQDALNSLFNSLATPVNIETSPFEVIKALLHVVLGNALDQLNQYGLNTQLLNVRVQDRSAVEECQDGAAESEADIVAVLNCQIKRNNFPTTFCMPEAMLSTILPLLESLPTKLLGQTLVENLPVNICLPAINLNMKSLMDLGEQDILLSPQNCGEDNTNLVLLYKDKPIFGAQLGNNDIEINHVIKSVTMNESGEMNIADGAQMEQNHSVNNEEALASFDQLPVDVHIVLDTQMISFSELCELGVGSTMPFSGDENQPVTLLANGSAFARAELLSVNDKMAVRITKMLTKG